MTDADCWRVHFTTQSIPKPTLFPKWVRVILVSVFVGLGIWALKGVV